LGYNALFSPFNPFNSESQALTFYGPINYNPTNWIIPEILVPTTSVPVYYTYKIVNIYPHDRTSFTQGLVYENGFLYEGTGISGRSALRKVDLKTGNVLQSIDLPSQYFGEGITILGDQIIQLTWLHNVGFVYDKSTFELLQEFYYPTEGWGITHNGKSLIMSDGTSTLHFLDPVTFAETSIIEVYDKFGSVSFINELEYIQGEIYANVFKTNRIARISSKTGRVLGWIDLKGLLSPEDVVSTIDVLNGIAYDFKLDRLFVTGKFWPKLFEIDLVPL
jgi:glutamine cyclotransferase